MKAEGTLSSDFVVVGRIPPDEERLVHSKSVVQFSSTYDVSIVIFIFIYTSIRSFFIYCIIMLVDTEEDVTLLFVHLCFRNFNFNFVNQYYLFYPYISSVFYRKSFSILR